MVMELETLLPTPAPYTSYEVIAFVEGKDPIFIRGCGSLYAQSQVKEGKQGRIKGPLLCHLTLPELLYSRY